MIHKLPPRTVERLSKYRRLLDSYKDSDDAHIHSHKLAALLNLTPEQVRRDLMLIGLNGNHRKGYNIKALIGLIGNTIDRPEGHKIAIVGIGNLGRAVLGFVKKSNTKINVVAAFDIDKNKINTQIAGVHCYDLAKAQTLIAREKIRIAILTVPPEAAVDTTSLLLRAGIRGILNFTSVHLDVPQGIYLKDYDIITSLEEIGFFIMD
ncbi:MAG TPA: redox-sensing transcriptional repressor Rex [Bacteroidales bacterium]|jgi:redox-sensing transcriptional repressor|nr:redox-sensing transcriptional repressor Rex [Bacteroidales bacterium]